MRACLAPLLLLPALAAQAQDSFVLKRTAAVGEEAKYTLRVDTTFGGIAVVFKAKMHEKVVAVTPEGGLTLESRQTESVLDLDGQTMDAGPESVSKISLHPDGRVAKIETEDVTDESYRVAHLNHLAWPEGEVAVGHKWSSKVAAEPGLGGVALESSFEILGLEEFAGVKAVVVGFKSAEVSGDTPASASGKHWVDAATGLVLKSEMEWKNAPVSGQIIDAKVVIEIVR
jgi:hypothetical protein